MDQAEPAVRRRGPRLWWLALLVLVIAVVVLFEVGRQLNQLQAAGFESFGPGAFTAPRWPPTDIAALGDALASWTSDPRIATSAGRWVIVHALVDLIAFTPACVLLTWHVLRWLGRLAGNAWVRSKTITLGLPVVLLAVEVAEGTATLAILRPWTWDEVPWTWDQVPIGPGGSQWIIPLLSTVKWAVLLAIAVVIAAAAYPHAMRAVRSKVG